MKSFIISLLCLTSANILCNETVVKALIVDKANSEYIKNEADGGQNNKQIDSYIIVDANLEDDQENIHKRYDYGHLRMPREESFDKKSIIKYVALTGLIYHLWYYKFETVQALTGALGHFFAGTSFTAAQNAQMKILARATAFGGGLLALYGLLGLYDDTTDYEAALEVKKIIAQHKISKKEKSERSEP